jgi:HAD superfamily phosphoserine phosphatase-like hydrolase
MNENTIRPLPASPSTVEDSRVAEFQTQPAKGVLRMPPETSNVLKDYLLISDFDQTLSFNDSGIVLSELLGIHDFQARIKGLSDIHMIQQGGELAYLLLHDPDYRRVRREHLIEVGKRIRLKQNIRLLLPLLEGLEGYRFSFYVVSAAPEEVIKSALEGIVPEDRIYGTRFRYADSGEIQSIVRVPAGYGKVAVVEQLREQLMLSHDRIIYVGDGSSDIHVMLHLNRLSGLTIAVSGNKYITQIATRTVLSDDALSVLIPIFEDIAGWDSISIRRLFESHGFVLREWDKVRTDSLTISRAAAFEEAAA